MLLQPPFSELCWNGLTRDSNCSFVVVASHQKSIMMMIDIAALLGQQTLLRRLEPNNAVHYRNRWIAARLKFLDGFLLIWKYRRFDTSPRLNHLDGGIFACRNHRRLISPWYVSFSHRRGALTKGIFAPCFSKGMNASEALLALLEIIAAKPYSL